MSSNSTTDTRKKSRSAPIDKKKLKEVKKAKKSSNASMKQSDTNSPDQSLLKYTLDFGNFVRLSNTLFDNTVSKLTVNNSTRLLHYKTF